ncbi:MAG: hypothetical protein GY725_18010 [bacterium]|nr:hypothetical protein [bacterium]
MDFLFGQFDDGRIANPGQCFQETDFVAGDFPRRKFIVGAQSGEQWLIVYRHGGFGMHDHLALLSTETEPPQVLFAASGSLGNESLAIVERAVRLGGFALEDELSHW